MINSLFFNVYLLYIKQGNINVFEEKTTFFHLIWKNYIIRLCLEIIKNGKNPANDLNICNKCLPFVETFFLNLNIKNGAKK
jgi:hypothetical protein